VSLDPFDTQDLRHAVLQAWRSSPTRFREDANAEEDLVLGGYRDRWFVELAQNAADAAARAGVPGHLRVYYVSRPSSAGAELRVANTGEPLDAAGVAALASLRASAKRDTGSVGRFGIGFAAVLPLSAEPRVVSRDGGVLFSASRTSELVAAEPRLRDELAHRRGRVPVLRLVWPTGSTDPGDRPPDGFDTEVRLPLTPDLDQDTLLAGAAAEAADLLLALPALDTIDVDGRIYRRRPPTAVPGAAGSSPGVERGTPTGPLGDAGTPARPVVPAAGSSPVRRGTPTGPLGDAGTPACPVVPAAGSSPVSRGTPTGPLGDAGTPARPALPDGGDLVILDEPGASTSWLVVRRDGELPAELLTAAEERHRPHWSVCWAVPVWVSPEVAAEPRPVGDDVLHAPTPTDERLSLPARLLASLPMEPSRRRVRPGPAAEYVLDQAVRAYPELVAALPGEHRIALVPHAGFPRSEVDAGLRDGVVAALRAAAWLPAAGGGPDLRPAAARVLDRPSPRLAELLADLVPGLGAAPLSEPAKAAAMVVLEVPRLGLAGVVAAVSGVRRPPAWWRELYAALAPLLDAEPAAREDLAALPVPLADGRTVTGPRGTLVVDGPVVLPELRIVHPDAVHPLLFRLGAQQSGPAALLDTPALREAVHRSVDDAEAGLDTAPLADTVLRLAAAANPAAANPAAAGPACDTAPPFPAGPGRPSDRQLKRGTPTLREAGVVPAEQAWLGALALPDETGEPRRADELVLPDGALRGLLAEDSPLGILHPDLVAAHPRHALRAVGVLDGFAVLVDESPTAADHDLDGEELWWASLAEPPRRLVAVRDLDLVADGAWPRALRLLAAEPDTNRALRDPYTRWWLARNARLAGHPPRHWRLPSATRLAGLYDPVPPSVVSGKWGSDTLYHSQGEAILIAAGVRTELVVADAQDAADLVARLADPGRDPSPGTVRAAHAALTAACAASAFDLEELAPPDRVRSVSGATVAAGRAYVLDLPWLGGIADAERAVAGGDAYLLADLLDLPLASDELAGDVVSTGREVPWERLPEVAAACEALAREVPAGTLMLHDRLTVRDRGGAEHAVAFWVDGAMVHADDPVRALLWGAVGTHSL